MKPTGASGANCSASLSPSSAIRTGHRSQVTCNRIPARAALRGRHDPGRRGRARARGSSITDSHHSSHVSTRGSAMPVMVPSGERWMRSRLMVRAGNAKGIAHGSAPAGLPSRPRAGRACALEPIRPGRCSRAAGKRACDRPTGRSILGRIQPLQPGAALLYPAPLAHWRIVVPTVFQQP